MIQFILRMLSYGVFLAVFVIFCMCFFFGKSIKQSVDWFVQKTTEIVSVSKDADFQDSVQSANAQIKKISKMVK